MPAGRPPRWRAHAEPMQATVSPTEQAWQDLMQPVKRSVAVRLCALHRAAHLAQTQPPLLALVFAKGKRPPDNVPDPGQRVFTAVASLRASVGMQQRARRPLTPSVERRPWQAPCLQDPSPLVRQPCRGGPRRMPGETALRDCTNQRQEPAAAIDRGGAPEQERRQGGLDREHPRGESLVFQSARCQAAFFVGFNHYGSASPVAPSGGSTRSRKWRTYHSVFCRSDGSRNSTHGNRAVKCSLSLPSYSW